MKRYEYHISKHVTEDLQPLTYLCSDDGVCRISEVNGDATLLLEDLLNERGREGWEVVQLVFGKGGMVAIWKRELDNEII